MLVNEASFSKFFKRHSGIVLQNLREMSSNDWKEKLECENTEYASQKNKICFFRNFVARYRFLATPFSEICISSAISFTFNPLFLLKMNAVRCRSGSMWTSLSMYFFKSSASIPCSISFEASVASCNVSASFSSLIDLRIWLNIKFLVIMKSNPSKYFS